MIPTPFNSKTTPWRVQVPASYFPDKKRKTKYFATETLAKEFCRKCKRFGVPAVLAKDTATEQNDDFAPLVAAAVRELGGNPEKLWEAVSYFKRTRLNVTPATVREAIEQFCEVHKTRVALRTWRQDKSRLMKLVRAFEHRQLSEITETDLHKFFDAIPGKKKSIYKSASVFFGWAKKYNLIAINPIKEVECNERWGVRKGIYSPAVFARMLRVAAGLEAPSEDREPTRQFIGLLPWFALSGFCGLRSCEAFLAHGEPHPEAIEWRDLYFDRGYIHIRPEVAKQTSREDGNQRFIKAPHHVEALKAWLELCPRSADTIVPFGEKKINQLKLAFTKATGIKFVGNGLRNSFASYTMSIASLAGVGALAIEMGNSEKVAKQFYLENLEPGIGKAWFGIRPGIPTNVISMSAVA